MALDDDTRVLSRVPLFAGFDTEQLRLLAFGAEHVGVNRGRMLYRENDEADCAFVIVTGRVQLFRGEVDAPVPIGAQGNGAILGSMALITDTVRPTSALAIQSCDLIRLTRRTFRRMLEEYPDLAVLLHRRISDEFLDLVAQVEALAPRLSD